MSIKIKCPGCGKSYKLDSSKLPSGTVKLNCKSCGTKFKIKPKKQDDTGQIERKTWEDYLAEEEEKKAAPEEEIEDLPEPLDEIVECPRCGHRFAAFGGESPEEDEDRRKRILVVDDQEFFINYVHDLLHEEFDIESAESVSKAVEKMDGWKPDLLILDLAIHGQEDGKQVLMKSEHKAPALILTGMDETSLMGELWHELERLGARAWVSKGIDIDEEMLQKVGKLLEE